MTPLGIVAVALALGVTAAGASLWAPTAPRVVTIDKLAFGASPGGLHVGDAVEWVNRDIFQHSVTGAGFDLDLRPGGRGRLIVTGAGVVPYLCRYHPGMKAKIVIAP